MKSPIEARAIFRGQLAHVLRWVRFAPAILASVAGLAFAGPPEVIKVRAPSDQVSRWFGGDVELTGMTADAFDDLVKAAGVGSSGLDSEGGPKWLTARHEALWEDGSLRGESTFTIAPSRSGPGELILSPWAPAVLSDAGDVASLRTDDAGVPRLRVPGGPDGPSTVTIRLKWALGSRPGSRGSRFTVGLGPALASEIRLELPEGLEPEGPGGAWRGPEAGSRPGRRAWTFLGRGEGGELRVFRPDGPDDAPDAVRPWCSDETTVETSESSAVWAREWSISQAPWGRRTFTFDLGPGMDLLGVTGAAVEDFEAGPSPLGAGRTRVGVRLRSPTASPDSAPPKDAKVTVRALARLPSEGPWVVPSAEAVDAVWTGGRTTVRLGPTHILAGVREREGRRTSLSSPTSDATGERALAFDSHGPGPVAELDLRRPWADVSAEVRGRLVVGGSVPRLEARLSWTIHRGRMHEIAFDLPATWNADRVEVTGVDAPIAWQAEPLPGGGTRVRVASPSGGWSDRAIEVRISATATVAGGRGPLALPRVRPAGARIADEVWLAVAESSLTLRPVAAKGLVWLDPSFVPPEPVNPISLRGEGPSPPAPESVGAATLAWRWVSDDAEGRIERERPGAPAFGSVDVATVLAADRLRAEARVTLSATEGVADAVAVGASGPQDGPSYDWRFRDEATGLDLDRRPMSDEAKAAAGLAGARNAWLVSRPGVKQQRLVLTARLDAPWRGQGPAPLLYLPTDVEARGVVVVRAARELRTTLNAQGTTTLDPDVASRSLAATWPNGTEPERETGPAATRLAHAFSYDSPEARAELRSEPLAPAPGDGLVREAVLRSEVGPDRATRHQLTLRVVPDRATALGLILPNGSVLERARRDSVPVVPTRHGQGLWVPLGTASDQGPRGVVVICLDYLGEAPEGPGPLTISPNLPVLSLPCVSLSWEVRAPRGWKLVDWSRATLINSPPGPPNPRLLDRALLKARSILPMTGPRPRFPSPPDPADVAPPEARPLPDRPDALALGDWLLRWDSVDRPILVDRIALAAAGWGPRSRLGPGSTERDNRGTGVAALKRAGLEVIHFGPLRVLTDRTEAAEWRRWWGGSTAGPEALQAALAEAAAWGSDRTDRFQSPNRWRDEHAPRGGLNDALISPPIDGNGGRETYRFLVVGWPDRESTVSLQDDQRSRAWGWITGLGVVTLGLAARRASRLLKGVATLALFGLGLAGMAFAPLRWEGVSAGLVGGVIALTCVSQGRLTPLPRFRGRGSSTGLAGAGPRRRGRGASVVAPFAIWGAATFLTAGATFAWQDDQAPILAILPYEGPPSALAEPTRVVLRLSDFLALKGLAKARPPRPAPPPLASGASHRVSWRGPDVAVVESTFAIEPTADATGVWSFPVENSREITATLDGRNVPVRIAPGGRTGTVGLGGGVAPRALVVRRTVTFSTSDRGASMTLSVNPSPVARYEVEPRPDGIPVEVVSAAGAARAEAGLLGPVDRLELRWASPGNDGRPSVSGGVDALALWDALPAGDRVRARLTYRAPGGTRSARIGLEPGSFVREARFPGNADVSWGGTADRPEWLARFDPPLPDGAALVLDVWRPLAPEAGPKRAVPRVEPLGAERYAGALAFRRPPDWFGRLGPGPGSEIMADDVFARAWGNLPGDPLTLSGALKLTAAPGRGPLSTVVTARRPDRARAETSAVVTLGPGRVGLVALATLTTLEGRVFEAQVVPPANFRVVEVSGGGLTDWSTTKDGSLRLRFDGPPARARRVKIAGWSPLPDGPGMVARSERDLPIPWPRWPGLEDAGGTLRFVSPSPVVATTTGSTPLPFKEPSAEDLFFGDGDRETYQVSKSSELGRARWTPPAPRVNVRVESQLTVGPESAEWLAVVRYDVGGGPLEAINLKLPAEWARAAKVGPPGRSPRRVAETQGDVTRWTIHPDRPIWGTQSLVIRSTLPMASGTATAFPDVIPLGFGSAETYLRIVNATGAPIAVSGSTGLQAIAPSSFPIGPEASASATGGVVANSFRVTRPGWTLKVQRPGDGGGGGPPRVERADHVVTIGNEGSTLGSATFEVAATDSPFLGVSLDPFSRPLWASVNGSPTRPLLAEGGRWQVPLSTDRPNRVSLVWWSIPPGHAPDGGRVVPIPTTAGPDVPVTVTVHAPEGSTVRASDARLRGASAEEGPLDNADWAMKRAKEALDALALDRTSRAGGEALVAALVRLEMILSEAERAARWSGEPAAADRAVAVEKSASRARAEVAEALKTSSLEAYGEAALAFLGRASGPESPSDAEESATPPSTEPTPLVRIRRVGVAQAFRGEASSRGHWRPLVWSPPSSFSVRDRQALTTFAILGPLGLAVAFVMSKASRRSPWPGRLALTTALGLATLGAGWGGLAAGVGLAVLGRVAPD